jgi:uncharacterized protein YegJ (DUF2314 family)
MFKFMRGLSHRILRRRSEGVDYTINDPGDAAIEAAIAQARETLPTFWRVLAEGDASDCHLKVGLTTPNGAIEHLWIKPAERREDKVIGRLVSEPLDLEDVMIGSEVAVDLDRISDWAYIRNGRMFGAFTQRAMLHQIKPSARRRLAAALSPTPLESEAN